MHKDSFDFVYNAEGDYYDLVVDKKIQKVVEELKALPHDVLIRYLTYWSEAIDSRKYVVESDLPHEEWYTDCCDYAASETDEERYMHAKCMAETLGHMLQDIKNNYPNKYPAAMRTVKSWKNYNFIGFPPTMREEIDNVWIEPNTWNDGKNVAMAFVPLLEVFMKQYEDGKNEEAAGNAFYLLERLARLHCKDVDYFEPDKESHCSYYEFLLEAVCHILTLVMKDKHRAYNKGIPTQIKDYSKLTEVGSLMYSDGTNIYDSHFNILPKADVATFEHISDNWYKDKSHVWWSSQLVAGANPKTFQPVSEGGFGGDFNYGKDDKHVF